METAKLLVVLIADYEAKHFTIEKASGVEVLKELMDANGLRQKDLADDLGGESIVSLILKEKRQLNRQQMEKLSHRFHVSPAVFFELIQSARSACAFPRMRSCQSVRSEERR